MTAKDPAWMRLPNQFGSWLLYICVSNADSLIEKELRFRSEKDAHRYYKYFSAQSIIKSLAKNGHSYFDLVACRNGELGQYQEMRAFAFSLFPRTHGIVR